MISAPTPRSDGPSGGRSGSARLIWRSPRSRWSTPRSGHRLLQPPRRGGEDRQGGDPRGEQGGRSRCCLPAPSGRASSRAPRAKSAYILAGARPDPQRHRGPGRGRRPARRHAVCSTSCDKTPPGHLMAAGRLDILRPAGDRRLPGLGRASDEATTSTSRKLFLRARKVAEGSTSKPMSINKDLLIPQAMPRSAVCVGHVRRQHHALRGRGAGHELAGVRAGGAAEFGAKVTSCALGSRTRIVEMVLRGPAPPPGILTRARSGTPPRLGGAGGQRIDQLR